MTPWDLFFKEKITKIFSERRTVIDIGGGLRVLKGRGNRYDPKRAWIAPYFKEVDYKILDPVPDFNPDIVGDIHHLPFGDASQEAILCLAVLEHVENPTQAFQEMFRVLKPGGYCFIYVPFLFYYHAEVGYYKDYWRFSEDAIRHLSRDFSRVEFQNVRGALETWLHISPLGRIGILRAICRLLDRTFGKSQSKQTSGYYAFLEK
ncbi:MAG: class I SAM-dependent methyltransferase [Parcubacteria group bacterium]|nr:class I SAM-dependent methyltransferase [Parcubacteria group bacterium]